MANDNRASFAVIGFTVCLGIAAIVGTLIYIGGIFGKGDVFLVETCYDKPVSGLSVGSAVTFRGVKVGEVREIDFVGNKYPAVNGVEEAFRVYLLLALDMRKLGHFDHVGAEDFARNVGDFVAKRGMRATVTLSGITGLSRVELDQHPDALPYAKLSWTPAHVFIPPKESLLESFSVSATRILNQVNKMDLAATWSNLSATVESFHHAADSARTMIEARQADVDSLLSAATEASAAARDFITELRRNPSLLVRERVAVPLSETER